MQWFWFLLFLALINFACSSRNCIQPVRRKNWEIDDPIRVPVTICHGDSCPHVSATDAATVVTYSLLAQDGVSDVVLLPAHAIQSEIQATQDFKVADLQRLIPNDEALVYMQINGSDILDAIEHGIDQHHSRGMDTAYPKVAGIRFLVTPNNPRGQRVSQAEIMTATCKWDAVDNSQYYHLLTTESLANGDYGYTSLSRTHFRTRTSRSLRDTFWYFAVTVGVLRDPFRRPIQVNPKFIKAQRRNVTQYR